MKTVTMFSQGVFALCLLTVTLVFATPQLAEAQGIWTPGGGDECADYFDANVTDPFDPRYCPTMMFAAASSETGGTLCVCPSAEAVRAIWVAEQTWGRMCPTFPPGLIGDDILGDTCERHWREVENKRACVIRNQAYIDGTFGWVFNLIEGRRPSLGTVVESLLKLAQGLYAYFNDEFLRNGDLFGAVIECGGGGFYSGVRWGWTGLATSGLTAVTPVLDNPPGGPSN
jgi:hypothetical protein